LHVIQMRAAAEDSQARSAAELALLQEKERLKAALEEINKLALYDTLTNLANRRLLNDRIGQLLYARQRNGSYAALIFIDLDNFKPLNDAHGHTVGDLLLIEVARRISDCVRKTDTVARFGGDEFVVALGDLAIGKHESTIQANNIAEKIRTSLAEPYHLTIKPEGSERTIVEHHCTSSIGVAVFNSQQLSLDDLLKWADAAMYQAKKAGRNTIRFFESPE
jgi:diguanylate cyclase (GGDEF)-like protein